MKNVTYRVADDFGKRLFAYKKAIDAKSLNEAIQIALSVALSSANLRPKDREPR